MAARPNIVLIVADDLGYGDPGCYNPDSQIPTPNLDRLAEEGARFDDAHSPCALCTPSRYGLLTGRYQWRSPKGHALAMPYEPPVIEPERPTIATMLKGAGYRTGCIGKWHLGLLYPDREGGFTQTESAIDFERPLPGGPIDLGFDTFFGSAGCSTSDAPYAYIEQDRTVGTPSIVSGDELNALPGFYPGLIAPGWRIDEVDLAFAERAEAFVAEQRADPSDDPFFLYLALSTPHNPWVLPDGLAGTSGDGARGDMVALFDLCVGRVVRALEANGYRDDTLVVVTSDHGPQYHTGPNGHRATGPFRGQKNTAFEGGHRVPFVARWPDRIAAGRRSERTICHTDLFATLADLIGAPLDPAAEDSFSVLPALLDDDEPVEERPALVCDTGYHGLDEGDFSIRRGRWKLIVAAQRPDEPAPQRMLFDLESDHYETADRYPDRPEIAADLEALLTRLRSGGARSLSV